MVLRTMGGFKVQGSRCVCVCVCVCECVSEGKHTLVDHSRPTRDRHNTQFLDHHNTPLRQIIFTSHHDSGSIRLPGHNTGQSGLEVDCR